MEEHVKVYPELMLTNTWPPCFNPSGGEFLAVDEDDALSRYGFPRGERIGRLPYKEAIAATGHDVRKDRFSGVVVYVSDDHALAVTDRGFLCLLDTNAMKVTGVVELAGEEPQVLRSKYLTGTGTVEVEETYYGLGNTILLPDNRLLTAHTNHSNKTYGLKLWDASPLRGCWTFPDTRTHPFTARLIDRL
jgi:hypothetical protein